MMKRDVIETEDRVEEINKRKWKKEQKKVKGIEQIQKGLSG